jgi:hypothetical protein
LAIFIARFLGKTVSRFFGYSKISKQQAKYKSGNVSTMADLIIRHQWQEQAG